MSCFWDDWLEIKVVEVKGEHFNNTVTMAVLVGEGRLGRNNNNNYNNNINNNNNNNNNNKDNNNKNSNEDLYRAIPSYSWGTSR